MHDFDQRLKGLAAGDANRMNALRERIGRRRSRSRHTTCPAWAKYRGFDLPGRADDNELQPRFKSFAETYLRDVAAANGVSYEDLTKDWPPEIRP